MYRNLYRKITAFLLAALLPVCVPVSAKAEEGQEARAVSAWCMDGVLHSFFQMPDAWKDTLPEVSAVLNGTAREKEAQPEAVSAGDTPVSYLLLVDDSTSMPAYRQWVLSFADALLKEERQETRVTVASFGAGFQVLKEDLTSVSGVKSVLSAMKYSQRASDISGGVTEAFSYLASKERESGELSSLILLTDGEPYLTGGDGNDESAVALAAEKAGKAIEETPEVIVHTVGLAEWETSTGEALRAGRGLHRDVRSQSAAAKAGREIAAYTDSLYRIDIPAEWSLGEGRGKAEYTLSFPENSELEEAYGLMILTLPEVGDVKEIAESRRAAEEEGSGAIPIEEAGSGTEAAGETEPEEPAAGEEPEEDSGEEQAQEADGEAGAAPTEETEESSGEAAEMPSGEETSAPGFLPGLAAALIAGAAVAAVIAALVRSQRRGARKGGTPGEDAIAMRLEILEGTCRNPDGTFLLDEPILIGSAPSCGLIIEEPQAAPQNSRIFRKDGLIYIEDLKQESSTFLNGMKIHAPNRLRSGDEIAIGGVRVRFWF